MIWQRFAFLPVLLIPCMLQADSVDYVHVRVAKIKASSGSTLVEKEKPESFYQAFHAFDGKVETAWCEGQEGPGIGEWLRADFQETKAIGVAVLNGYGKFRNMYKSNNRIKKMKLTISLANNKEKIVEINLKDNTCGWDDAGGKISSPEEACAEGHADRNSDGFKACVERVKNECIMDEYNGGGERFFFKQRLTIKGVKLEILDVYKGEKHDDTCIADIRLIETSGNVGSDYFKRDERIKKRY